MEEVVVITYRGKSCAKFVPYRKERKKMKKDELFGIWKEHEDIQNVEESEPFPDVFPDKILITRAPSYIPPYFSMAVPVGFLPDDINL